MTSLRDDIELALSQALGQVMNGQAHDLPPLSWTQAAAQRAYAVSGYARHDVAAARAWAARFDLTAIEPNLPGTRDYQGAINELPVRIWVIVDQRRYDADMRALVVRVTPEPKP